ncbi:MAG TPA: hypothetical protein DEH78_31190 [Solibacterales bacterium]|nr:hypothetical protein [Bryobacterales bacterium]
MGWFEDFVKAVSGPPQTPFVEEGRVDFGPNGVLTLCETADGEFFVRVAEPGNHERWYACNESVFWSGQDAVA